MDECVVELTDGWMPGGMDGWMEIWTDGWVVGCWSLPTNGFESLSRLKKMRFSKDTEHTEALKYSRPGVKIKIEGTQEAENSDFPRVNFTRPPFKRIRFVFRFSTLFTFLLVVSIYFSPGCPSVRSSACHSIIPSRWGKLKTSNFHLHLSLSSFSRLRSQTKMVIKWLKECTPSRQFWPIFSSNSYLYYCHGLDHLDDLILLFQKQGTCFDWKLFLIKGLIGADVINSLRWIAEALNSTVNCLRI